MIPLKAKPSVNVPLLALLIALLFELHSYVITITLAPSYKLDSQTWVSFIFEGTGYFYYRFTISLLGLILCLFVARYSNNTAQPLFRLYLLLYAMVHLTALPTQVFLFLTDRIPLIDVVSIALPTLCLAISAIYYRRIAKS